MRWFAVYTKCHHERTVDRLLSQKGVSTFYPAIEVPSLRWDRRKTIQKPLFPGYLFVNIPPDPVSFLEVVRTPGLCYILGNNGKPVPVPDDEVLSLKIFLREKCKVGHYPFLKKGDRVRIISGALKGAVGMLVQEDSRKRRLVVSIELMRRSIAVWLQEEEVEPY